MAKRDRNGYRERRKDKSRRIPDLGYYLIITDTKETERNYLIGLRDSLPEKLAGRIVIKVKTAKTSNLITQCEKELEDSPNYRIPWIVLDRDKVPDFNVIIETAERKGINTGWSNPCIEVWLQAYFGKMSTTIDSPSCCRKFEEDFEKRTLLQYKKSDNRIYKLLTTYGDEKTAIALAENKHKQLQQNSYLRGKVLKPSEMSPCTTLYLLVKDIAKKKEQVNS